MALIGMVYRLHGSLRSLFAGPNANTGLVLLEALALGSIHNAGTPPTVSEIGRELGFSRQSVQRAVNKLVELGLARSLANPRHKKAPVFIATKAGAERMALVQAPSRQLAADLAPHFDDTRTQQLIDELDDLLAAIRACGQPQGTG